MFNDEQWQKYEIDEREKELEEEFGEENLSGYDIQENEESFEEQKNSDIEYVEPEEEKNDYDINAKDEKG